MISSPRVNKEGGDRMENIKFTVKMLAALMKQTIAELAESAGIEPNHLQQVSTGRLKMSAYDLVQLSDYTGIDVHNIEY